MITYFPKPYEDELLYSLIARFANICFPGNPQGLNLTLFNYRRLRATIDLPCFTEQLSQKTSHLLALDACQIINQLTLLPFYRSIVAEGVVNNLENLMKSDYAGNIHAKIGINASGISRSRFPRYCKQCVNDELEILGESYWHRTHQLPGMLICPVHLTFLEIVHSIDHLTYIVPFESKFRSNIIYSDQELLKTVSKKLQSYLFNPVFIRNENYKSRLIDAGYARGRFIDTKRTIQDFEKYFGRKTLELFHHETGVNHKWVSDIVRNPEKTFNPVRHILIDLFTSSLSKISYPRVEHPFGNGPWICINKASSHYLKNVVTSLFHHTDVKTKRLIGVFKCECGMEYTKSYITRKSGLVENIRITVWGKVWEERLHEELKTDASLRRIAKLLGTDAKTIARHKNSGKNETDQVDSKAKIIHNKALWVKYFKNNPHHSVSDARAALKSVYASLYRNSKSWLLEYNVKHYKASPDQLKLRLNWPEIDTNIYSHLKTAFKSLLESNHKGRITRSLLAKTINEESRLLHKNSSRLPECTKFLNEKCESIIDYQKRRIKTTVTFFREKKIPIKEWSIARHCGLKHPVLESHKNLIKQLSK